MLYQENKRIDIITLEAFALLEQMGSDNFPIWTTDWKDKECAMLDVSIKHTHLFMYTLERRKLTMVVIERIIAYSDLN